MFRLMRRINQQVSDDECKKVLKDEKRAAFSVIDENGYPYTVPVNFFYGEEENKYCTYHISYCLNPYIADRDCRLRCLCLP